MRGIFFGLLLTNLLYLGWNLFVPQVRPLPVRLAAEVINEANVVLVAELSPEHLRYYPSPSPSPSPSPDQIPVSSSEEAALARTSVESMYCAEIGTFRDEVDAQAFVGAYAERLALTLDIREVSVSPDYRVFLPPLASKELAASTMEALKITFVANSLSIDTFLITRGELANGIALGLFSEQSNALNVQQQMEKLGYKVVVRTEPKLRKEYWVLALNIQSEADFQQQWEQMRLSRSYVQAGEKLCETIAQAP